MLFTLILGFVLGAGAIVFILQNTAVVALTFLGWQFESTIAVIVILAILVGAVLALLLTLPGAIGSSFKMRALNKNNEALAREAELHRQSAEQAKSQLIAAQVQGTDQNTTV